MRSTRHYGFAAGRAYALPDDLKHYRSGTVTLTELLIVIGVAVLVGVIL